MSKMLQGSAGVMQRAGVRDGGITAGTVAGKSTSSGISKMSQGSAGVMERAGVRDGGIMHGANSAGKAEGTDASMMMQGSSGVLERDVPTDGGITRGADVNDIPEQPTLEYNGTSEQRRKSAVGQVQAGEEEEEPYNWYFMDEDDETQGPHPGSHMDYWRETGYITDDMYVCVEGDEEWRQSSEVKTFATNEPSE